MSLVNDNIERLIPYKPGKPIEDVERELGISGSVKLASNENPVGPSPKALEAITRALKGLNRYPDGNATRLKGRLSEHAGVPVECIIVGNGSNEIIELAARTFMRPGEEAVMSEHAFVVYKLIVTAAGGVPCEAPMKGFTHDLKAMCDLVTDNTRLLFIANPNNPTGTFNTSQEIDKLLAKLPDKVIVVLDEAYREYVEDHAYPDSLRYIDKNVITQRTFSKLYGIAGLRVGYGLAKPELVQYMNRIRQPFNVNSLAQAAAAAALDDEEHVEKARKVNRDGMKFLVGEFKRLELDYVPSVANFILVDTGVSSAELFDKLLKKGVIVRAMKEYGFPNHIRVTVGLKEENEKFINALEEVL